MSSLLFIFAVVAFLIAVNGLYVAAEFSAVSARRPRLAQLADSGDSTARTILDTISDPRQLDVYIAACQVGITVSSLMLGFYAQNQIVGWAAPYFGQLPTTVSAVVQPAASVIILLGLTILQVILGELIPKNIGIQFPERLVLWTAMPMQWSLVLFRPMIWVFNGSGRLLLRIFGARAVAEHAHVHSPEEIVLLVEASSAGGVLDHEERRLLVNTLQLRKQSVRRIMAPRSRMLAADVNMPAEDVFRLLASSPYSRLPLYEGSVDKIVGLVHLKDLLQLRYWQRHPTAAGDRPQNLRNVMHPVLFVPDSIQIEDVIAHMQTMHQNIAIVVDEYGGTAGLVTFEDLMEEIIGDFQDEFDAENPGLRLTGKNQLIVRGDVQLEDLSQLLGILLAAPEVDTIGGLVAMELGKIPVTGEIVAINEIPIRVEKMDGHRVAEISITLTSEQFAQLKEMTYE